MSTTHPRLVGIKQVALEVGELEAALALYDAIFELRGVQREPQPNSRSRSSKAGRNASAASARPAAFATVAREQC